MVWILAFLLPLVAGVVHARRAREAHRSLARSCEIVLRYLAAFGPATTSDIRTWSRLTGLREVVERLRPGLRTFRDERGRELFDLPDAPRPGADMPAPPGLMADYENLYLGYADRSRFGDLTLESLAPDPRYFLAAMTADGMVVGYWRLDARASEPEIALRPRPGIGKDPLKALKSEGDRLLADLCGGRGRITIIA